MIGCILLWIIELFVCLPCLAAKWWPNKWPRGKFFVTWVGYRFSGPVLSSFLLGFHILLTFLLGFFLHWSELVPDIGSALWDLGLFGCIGALFRSIENGNFFGGLLSGIKTVYDVLGGNGESLRSAYPNLISFTTALSLLTPLLTISTVILNFIRFIPMWMRNEKEYLIFSQLEERALLLAEDMMDSEVKLKQRRVIFLHTEKDKLSTEQRSRVKKIRARVYPYSETDLMLIHRRLRKQYLRFFFLSPNTDESIHYLKAFIDSLKDTTLFKATSEPDQDEKENMGIYKQEFYLLSESDSSPLLVDRLRADMCDVRGNRLPVFKHTELRLLDRYRIVTYDLLQKHPLYEKEQNHQVRILILGFGRVGQSFFRSAKAFSAMHGYNFSFTIFDSKEKEHWLNFLSQAPEFENDSSVSHEEFDLETDQLVKHLKASTEGNTPFTYIVLSLGDDDRNIRVTRSLVRYYRKYYWETCSSGQTPCCPSIFVNLENPVKTEYVRKIFIKEEEKSLLGLPSPHVIGGDYDTFSEKLLLNRRLWCAAKYLHITLNKGTKSEYTGSKFLSEYERRSSIAAVSHAKYHTHAIKRLHRGANASYDILKKKQKEKMIKAEHNRWVHYSKGEGMVNISDVTAKTILSKIGMHRDDIGCLTPCLISMKKLRELPETLYGSSDTQMSFIEKDELVVKNSILLHEYLEEDGPVVPLL